MKIELVNINGRLVGRRFQDRWNLEMLGWTTPIVHSRNSSAVKVLRRAEPDFTFTIVKGDMVEINESEYDLLSPALVRVAA